MPNSAIYQFPVQNIFLSGDMIASNIGSVIFVGNKANLTVVSTLDDMNRYACWRYSGESSHSILNKVKKLSIGIRLCFILFCGKI